MAFVLNVIKTKERHKANEHLVFQLRPEGGEAVEEIAMPAGMADWTTLVELETGSYELKVANHPEWVCHITVQ